MIPVFFINSARPQLFNQKANLGVALGYFVVLSKVQLTKNST